MVQLNPVIRGWAASHRHRARTRTCTTVAAAIFAALWRWAQRRPPHTHRRWIAQQYCTTQGDRPWVVHGTRITPNGASKAQYLYQAATMPMQRHTKIKAAATPYDPAWEVDCEARLGVKREANLRGRQRLLHLGKAPNGLCPIWHQQIPHLTGWHNPHSMWRSLGGSDNAAHRGLLPPHCHRQVHSQGVEVVKPRPATGV